MFNVLVDLRRIEGRACGLHGVDWGWGRYNRRLSYDDSNPQVSYGLSSSQAERVAGFLNVWGFKLAEAG